MRGSFQCGRSIGFYLVVGLCVESGIVTPLVKVVDNRTDRFLLHDNKVVDRAVAKD